jgi:hypothetical protein
MLLYEKVGGWLALYEWGVAIFDISTSGFASGDKYSSIV